MEFADVLVYFGELKLVVWCVDVGLWGGFVHEFVVYLEHFLVVCPYGFPYFRRDGLCLGSTEACF